jgi:hypothetical protein
MIYYEYCVLIGCQFKLKIEMRKWPLNLETGKENFLTNFLRTTTSMEGTNHFGK